MKTISAYISTAGLSAILLAATLAAQTTDGTAPSNEISKVRIVRLSEVRGVVALDRDTGRGFEPAVANLPIVEKSRLQTGQGVAEVEFEDNSTLRLAPNSLVEFPQLDRVAGGATATSVHLVKGMAYVSLMKTRGNEFNLLFGQQKLQLPPASHIRLQLNGAKATLAVLGGAVPVDGPSGPMDVTRKKTVTFNMQGEAQGQAQPEITKSVVAGPYDAWDQSAAGYHAQTAGLSAYSSSPYAYGLNDMAYYGSFQDAGSCGSMWRPYFASAAWNPFANGVWAWYPSAGYSWVSPYPWGWTPYHFGSWSYCDGTGWGWMPGGAWNGLNNVIAGGPANGPITPPINGPVKGPVKGPGPLPVRPLQAPAAGASTLTLVNLRPLVRSEITSANSFVFRRDSAGLGIPRESLGSLNKLSQRAVNRGMASMPIYVSSLNSEIANERQRSAEAEQNSIRQETERSYEPGRPSEFARPSEGEMPSHMGSMGEGGGSMGGESRGSSSSAAAPASGHK